MAYIGNTVQNQGFAPAIDYFSGNGSTVTFTLSRPVASVAQMIVAIDNVIQNPSSAFTVTGNSITFTSAPLSGTNNIWVEYTSLITTYAAISQDPSVIGDITASGGFLSTGDFGNTFTDGTIIDYVTGNARITTGASDGLTIYNGGTASRSVLMSLNSSGALGVGTSPSYGTAGQFLQSQGSSSAPQWVSLSTPSINTIIIAGGGGGGHGANPPQFAGGGAGGAIVNSTLGVVAGNTYTITVGGGGNGGGTGTNGSNTTAFGLTAIGGGGAGGGGGSFGQSGGSGGGQGGSGGSLTPNNASGTAGQGNQGGSATAPQDAAGGGGGYSSAGGNASGTTPGTQGAGLTSSITGSSQTYAGGGGAVNTGYRAGYSGSPSASANSGSGGGGSAGNGGSGIVVVSYSTGYKLATATGTYTQTTSGGNYIFTFTGSGTITF